ncbi:MAG: cytochrome c [Thiogranum sp.]|nr:cytochrome c [Thiogranum sp.]
MQKKPVLRRLNLVLASGLLLTVQAPGAVERVEINRGAILSASCAGCHGTDGASPAAVPNIAGKSAEFIENTMLDFRSGKRPGTVMNRHASGYTDEEIRLIAEFFATRE